jgi:ATP-binding cassette, subfamily B (MDR/TAP), member 1
MSRQWKLSLVVYTIIPLTMAAVAATVAVDVKLEVKLRQGLESGSSLARDALANVRDVFSCTAESHIISQYDALLQRAMQFGFKKAPAIGLQYCSELFFVSIGYTLSFWYGTKLYSDGEGSIGGILMFVSSQSPGSLCSRASVASSLTLSV